MEKKILVPENSLHTKYNTLHLTVSAISFPFILRTVMSAWIQFCYVER